MKTQTEKSIIQVIFSVILLVALFLPWVRISFMGESLYSISFFEAIKSASELGSNISHLSSYTSHSITNYLVLLYLIPFLYIANIVCQAIGKYPVLSFYLTIIPVGIAYGLVIYAEKSGLDSFKMAGIGLWFSLLIGTLSILMAWINIGWEYRRHKKYLLFVFIWVLFSMLFMTFSGYIGSMVIDKSLDPGHLKDDSMSGGAILYLFFNAITSIGMLHLPFLIFGGVVMLISKLSGTTSLEVPTIEPTMRENTNSNGAVPTCPQCAKRVLDSMRYCPHCGFTLHGSEEVAEEANDSQIKEVEDESLRYAPPQYRKEE